MRDAVDSMAKLIKTVQAAVDQHVSIRSQVDAWLAAGAELRRLQVSNTKRLRTVLAQWKEIRDGLDEYIKAEFSEADQADWWKDRGSTEDT